MISVKAEAVGERGMVATKHPLATAAALRVLRDGGNAVDAAVTAAFVLGVVEPWMSGIGGGGYFLYRRATDGRVQVVDLSMAAPHGAHEEMYPLDESGGAEPELPAWPLTTARRHAIGPLAVAVPGMVAGLDLALTSFGEMDLADALLPAIELAEHGWPLDWLAFLHIAVSAPRIALDEATSAIFLPQGRLPALLNTAAQPLIRQPDLARTLRTIASEGAAVFYRGELATRIARSIQRAGGVMTEADLAAYAPRLSAPMSHDHAGMSVITTGAETGGPAVLSTLRDLGALPEERPRSPAAVRRFARAARASMADHISGLHLSAGSTTHISVVDRERNLVSLTCTLHSRFGAHFTVPGTGVLMNNGMLWFDPRPGRALSVVPGARPPTNMAPTLVVSHGRPYATVGASGGRRIPGAVAQIVHDLVVHGLGPQAAIELPRVDASSPTLLADERLGDAVIAGLRADGHDVISLPESPYPQHFASPVAILIDPATGALRGGGDPFTNASCAGY